MKALTLLTTEFFDAAAELAAMVPGVQLLVDSAADQVEKLTPSLDTPAGNQQLVYLLQSTIQEIGVRVELSGRDR